MRRAVFSILVGNSSGVLSRVAGMFSRRGYNIDSLTVGETLNPELSRMTIAVTGEDDVLERGPEKSQQVSSIADIFRANIVDVSKESMIIALTGSLSKMNAFVELLEDFNITEIARTGITGLARGSADMNKM